MVLLQFQVSPGEYPKAHAVDTGKRHEPYILVKYVRIAEPLLRIVVAAV